MTLHPDLEVECLICGSPVGEYCRDEETKKPFRDAIHIGRLTGGLPLTVLMEKDENGESILRPLDN